MTMNKSMLVFNPEAQVTRFVSWGVCYVMGSFLPLTDAGIFKKTTASVACPAHLAPTSPTVSLGQSRPPALTENSSKFS